jgi:hypothetical protein
MMTFGRARMICSSVNRTRRSAEAQGLTFGKVACYVLAGAMVLHLLGLL